MKRTIKLAIISALCLCLIAGLSGCFSPLRLVDRARREAERAEERIQAEIEGSRADYDDDYGDYEDYRRLDFDMSELDGLDQKNNPNDRRELTSHTGQRESKLKISAENASSVILRQSTGDDDDRYAMEYDPAAFRVEIAPDGKGELEIHVVQLKREKRWLSYKCYLTIPNRAYEKLEIEADSAGFSIDRVASPLNIDAENSGISLVRPAGRVDFEAKSSGISILLSKDYAAPLRFQGEDLGFSLRFSDGAPENFKLTVTSKDSVVVSPWSGIDSSFEHQNGSGGAAITLDLRDSAAAITE